MRATDTKERKEEEEEEAEEEFFSLSRLLQQCNVMWTDLRTVFFVRLFVCH
jgi:hypothetical protein